MLFRPIAIAWAVALSCGAASGQAQVPLQAPLDLDQEASRVSTSRPNIVFILTDDQDLHLGSLDYTPLTRKHLLDEGTFYSRHFVTIAVCCPSRVSLWTGKAAHNTNVTDVHPPYGGYPKFISQGLNSNWLPLWLQEAGYNTYYTGKLFNAHTVENYDKPHVSGFTGSDFLLDPYTYQYLNSSFQRDHDPPKYYPGEYSTDILASKANGLLDEAAEAGKPFFLAIAPNAPHSNVAWSGDGTLNGSSFKFTAPISAERHKHLFKEVKIPRTKNFNPDKPSGVNWISTLPKQSEENVEYNDHFYRERLRALQAVDELVDGIIKRLDSHGLLDNTYVIYTADNGFHIGQHRLQPGKECGFEEDINVPLIIRGPNVARNVTTEVVTTHTDLSPTILNLIGAKQRPDFDGSPIPIHSTEIEAAAASPDSWHEHVNVEFWGLALGEGQYGSGIPYYNNTYKGLRLVGKRFNLYYSVWCNNIHELYDLNTDPGQLHNLLGEDAESSGYPTTVLGIPIEKLSARLDSLLFVLKSCKGDTCVRPWAALHEEGVSTLEDALNPEYDNFYEVEQVRIHYNRCELGYIVDAEGPQFENDGLLYRHGAKWHEWV